MSMWEMISNISNLASILLTPIAVFFAFKTYQLSKNDKQKTIAIKELQNQTKHLEQLYLYQVQPRFVVIPKGSDYIDVQNIGGDCYKLVIDTDDGIPGNYKNPFINLDSNQSSSTILGTINYKIHSDKNYVFVFQDKFGNKMRQILFTNKRKFTPVEYL